MSDGDKPDKSRISFLLEDADDENEGGESSGSGPEQGQEEHRPSEAGPSSLSERASRPRPFVCAECGTGFKYKHHLQRHFATIHQKLRPFVCDVEGCGKSFGLRENMNKHKRMVHENVRPFPCRVCGTRFKQREHLSQHLMKHRRDGDIPVDEPDEMPARAKD
mmetsp:Transcript_29579/g.71935  ORF Transcript_29579/g.71935 Transcript_29579/m.71935 type:complete len:163 (+) Transcript_29579:277-765(+)